MSETPALRSTQPNLDPQAWVDAAFDALAEGGIDAVRIDPLAKVLGVTRGSFYWHFKDRAALHHAMLAEWRRRASYQIFARLEGGEDSAEMRLKRVLALPARGARSVRAANIELAIRLWARRDKDAAKALRHIDRARLRYFTTLMRQHGVAKDDAKARAMAFYAYLLSEAWIRVDNKESLGEACGRFLLQTDPH